MITSSAIKSAILLRERLASANETMPHAPMIVVVDSELDAWQISQEMSPVEVSQINFLWPGKPEHDLSKTIQECPGCAGPKGDR